jgi:osmotically-inducible protein OsmY
MKSNERLQRKVMNALKWELLHTGVSPTVNDQSSEIRAELGVTAMNGVITLTGHVDSYAKKMAVEHAAKSVRGVRAVAEEIEVQLDRDNFRSDTDIAEEAVLALRWCTSVPDKRITVSVENGWVTLEGNVEWSFEKDEARREIEEVSGVMGITNHIIVQPEQRPSEIMRYIQRVLQGAFSLMWHGLRLPNHSNVTTSI